MHFYKKAFYTLDFEEVKGYNEKKVKKVLL